MPVPHYMCALLVFLHTTGGTFAVFDTSDIDPKTQQKSALWSNGVHDDKGSSWTLTHDVDTRDKYVWYYKMVISRDSGTSLGAYPWWKQFGSLTDNEKMKPMSGHRWDLYMQVRRGRHCGHCGPGVAGGLHIVLDY